MIILGLGDQGNWESTYNRQQKQLRHFTKMGLFDDLLTSKEENKAFPPPSPPCNDVPLFKLPIENHKQLSFEWREGGRGVDSFVPRSYPI